jgi:hypothetical protein
MPINDQIPGNLIQTGWEALWSETHNSFNIEYGGTAYQLTQSIILPLYKKGDKQ